MIDFKLVERTITDKNDRFTYGVDRYNDGSTTPWMLITDWYHANAWKLRKEGV